eukprot:130203-Prymnesium_polylepis.1
MSAASARYWQACMAAGRAAVYCKRGRVRLAPTACTRPHQHAMQKAAPIGLPSVFEVAGAGEATCSRPAAVVMGESAGGNLATMAAT